MSDQLTFDVPLPSHAVDAERAALLDLIAGDPGNRADTERIIGAIVWVANRHLGVVDPNLVRTRLQNPDTKRLTVKPQLVGPVYRRLCKAGVLVDDGWCVNSDREGGNAGKPCHRYKMRRAQGVLL